MVVVVSWVLDIVFRNNEDAAAGVGLLIILRLWRITRIINGIVLSVQKQAEQKIEKEKHLREAVEEDLARLVYEIEIYRRKNLFYFYIKLVFFFCNRDNHQTLDLK